MWLGGGRREVFVYICKGVRRWAGAAGDLSLVDTVATGELQFFVPALHLELSEGSRSGTGVGGLGAFAEGGDYHRKSLFGAGLVSMWLNPLAARAPCRICCTKE